jgi:hypothetical protein
VNTNSTLAPDAAMVLGIASTAMPFARTREAQAERWLRLLREHGEAGVALQALGVSDASRGAAEGDRAEGGAHAAAEADSEGDVVKEVSDRATHIASRRGAACVSTVDVLLGVMRVYGDAFDRVLRRHGTDSDTVLVLLDAPLHESAAT